MVLESSVQVLVADDSASDRRLLAGLLGRWGYDPVPCEDGIAAWRLVEAEQAPGIMILDWMMPGLDGVELCRRVRERGGEQEPYILLLTERSDPTDLAKAFEAGANDFVTKPFDQVVLEARLRNGVRTRDLQARLADRVTELEQALAKVKRLQGLLPICSYCKRVRADKDYWGQVEDYLTEHADMKFTHSICPSCYTDVVEPQLQALDEQLGEE